MREYNLKTKNSKSNSVFVYMFIMLLVVMIMLLAPALNKKIYAATFTKTSDMQPEMLLGDSYKNKTVRKESKAEALERKKLYDLLSSKMVSNDQKLNFDFSKTNEPIQDAFTFGQKDSMHLELLGKFTNEGKMFDPVGKKRIEEGYNLGYSLTELNEDAGVFCIEEGAPLKGIPRGKGHTNPGSQANVINTQLNGRTGLNSNDEKITSNLIKKFAEATKEQNNKLLTPGTKEQILSNLEQRDASNSTPDKLSDNNVTIARPVVTDRINTPGFGELKSILENQGVRFVKDNNGGWVIPSDQEGILYQALDQLKNGIKIAQTNNVNVEGAVIAVKSLEKVISDGEADIAYILSQYEQKAHGQNLTRPTKYIADQLSNLSAPHRGSNSIQEAIWSSDIAKQARKWAKNSLAKEADKFKAYWKQLRDFEDRVIREGDKYYDLAKKGQRLLFGKGYWKNPLVSQNKDTGVRIGAGSADGTTNSYADNEIVLKNPQVKYQPKVLPGEGSTLEKSSIVNFDKNTQKWIMGPFKIDYILGGSETDNDREGSKKVAANGELAKYFSGITKVHLYGKYENGKASTKSEKDINSDAKWSKSINDAMNERNSFDLNKEEATQGISEIKSWRMKIARGQGKTYGPDMKKQDKNGKYSYGIPAPNEEFYFEVDYDPALKSIVKARFEFAYMVFAGNRTEYRLFGNTAQLGDVTKKLDVKVVPTTYKPEGFIENNFEGNSVDPILNGLRALDGLINSFRRPSFIGHSYKLSSEEVVGSNSIAEEIIKNSEQSIDSNPYLKPNKPKFELETSVKQGNIETKKPETQTVIEENKKQDIKEEKTQEKTQESSKEEKENKTEEENKTDNKDIKEKQKQIEDIKSKLTDENAKIDSPEAIISLLNEVGSLLPQLFNSPEVSALTGNAFGGNNSIIDTSAFDRQTSGFASGEGALSGFKVEPIANTYVGTAEGNVKTSQQQTLMTGDSAKWIEEVALEMNFTNVPTPGETPTTTTPTTPGTPGTPPNTPPTPGGKKIPLNLMVPIAGKVWEDRPGNNKKHIGYDNLLGTNNDVNLDGIKVTIFRNFVNLDDSGSVMNVLDRQYARLYDASGEKIKDYKKLFTNNGSYGPYYVHDLGFTKSELSRVKGDFKHHAISFDVRFDYDGIKYEPVMPMQIPGEKLTANKVMANVNDYNNSDSKSKAKYYKSSLAFENSALRDRFNAINGTIAGDKQLSADGTTIGKTIPVGSKHGMKAVRKIEYKLNKNVFSDSSRINRVESNYQGVKPKDTSFSPNIFMNASTQDLGIKLPANDKVRFDGGDKAIPEAYQELAGVYYDAKSYMLNINLGLKKRAPVNVQVQKALNNAMLTVNKKAYVYNYSDVDLDTLSKDEKKDGYGNTINLSKDMSVKDKKSEDIQPKLDIYKTDYIYRTSMYNTENKNPELNKAIEDELKQEKAKDKQALNNKEDINPRELDVFLTYRINVSNQSAQDIVNVNAIDDYYNDKMELVKYDIKKLIETDPKKSVETSNSGGLALEQKEVDVLNPSYLVRSGADALKVPSSMPKVGQKDKKGNVAKAIATEKLTSIADKYKSDVKLPNGVAGHRLTGADKAGIVLGPDEAANIYLTFRIKKVNEVRELLAKADSKDALGPLNKDLGNITKLNDSLNLGDFGNVAELSVFTTYDAISKKASGKVLDSAAPDNIDTKSLEILTGKHGSEKAKFEVDTDDAATIKVRIKPEDVKDEEKTRKLSGILWEDKRNTNNRGIETGDGQFDPKTEKGIKGQPVTLEERISLKANNKALKESKNLVYNKSIINGTKYVDIPFIWPDNIKSEKVEIKSLKALNGYESTVTTKDGGLYEFKGIPAGNMVVTLDYTSPNAKAKAEMYKKINGKDVITAAQNSKDIKFTDLVPTADYNDRDVKFYNGLDFKNTMFYSKGGNSNVNSRGDYYNPLNVDKTWLSKDKTATPYNSYLRDDEVRRVEIAQRFKEMKNSNVSLTDIFRGKLAELNTAGSNETEAVKVLNEKLVKAHNLTSMRATTPKLNFSIEYYEKLNKIKGLANKAKTTSILDYKDLYAVDGIYLNNEKTAAKSLGYDVNHINLGLVERPNTKVVMNKEITEIDLRSSDGKEILNLKYNVKADITQKPSKSTKDLKYGESINGAQKVSFVRELDRKNSTGYDKVLELNRSDNLDGKLSKTKSGSYMFKSGFKYINVDEKLLQNATLNIKYGIYAYNLGNIDKKISSNIDFRNAKENLEYRELAYRVGMDVGEGTLTHHSDPGNFGFGRFTGLEYYMFNNENNDPSVIKTAEKLLKKDEVSDVVITNVMEVTDNDTNLNLSDSDNQMWKPASKEDLAGALQNNTPTTKDLTTDPKVQVEMKDSKGDSYIKSKKGNVDTNIYILKAFSKSLKPFKYLEKAGVEKSKSIKDVDGKEFIQTWTIKPSSLLANGSQGSLAFENVVELLGYTTGSGVRSSETPGNIMQSLDEAYDQGKGVIIGDKKTEKVVPSSISKALPKGALVTKDSTDEILKLSTGGYHGIAQSDLTSVAALKEYDSASSEIVTLSPPTGLSEYVEANNFAKILVLTVTVMALGTMYISSLKYKKK